MPWTPNKWGATSLPEGLGSVTPQDVVTAALDADPEFIQGAVHPFKEGEEEWDYTFYAYYRVKVKGWYVSLAVHKHIRTTDPPAVFMGNMFIPGYGNWGPKARHEFSGDFPKYQPELHVHKWTNSLAKQSTRFTGNNRYPSKTS
jgi:hypothetical protein